MYCLELSQIIYLFCPKVVACFTQFLVFIDARASRIKLCSQPQVLLQYFITRLGLLYYELFIQSSIEVQGSLSMKLFLLMINQVFIIKILKNETQKSSFYEIISFHIMNTFSVTGLFFMFIEHKHLGSQLEEYVAKLPIPTRVVRTPERVGLIRAR